jgi:hypothetical protein
MPIRHQDILRLRENLKKLQSFRVCTDSYEDLRDKLAIITVRALFKECFQEFGENAFRISEHLEVLKRMGFNVKVTGLPSPYFYGAPQVPSWFLKEYMSMSEIARQNECCIWLYVENNAENKILSSVHGALDEGYVLGYPDCCIKWYEEMWKKQTEVLYQYILRRYNAKDQSEIMEKLGNSNAENFAHLFLQIFTDVNLEKTVKTFPFVFHIACEKCLKNSKSPTALINEQNKHLASELNHNFHERIEDASKDYALHIKQRSASQKNDFYVLKKEFPWLSDLLRITDLGLF